MVILTFCAKNRSKYNFLEFLEISQDTSNTTLMIFQPIFMKLEDLKSFLLNFQIENILQKNSYFCPNKAQNSIKILKVA